jgi:single-stranded-DNA-specific exonuclease
MKKWVLLRKGADFDRIAHQFNISKRLALLIRNREIIGDDAIETYLNGTLDKLSDGLLMKDMDKAISIISDGISDEKKMRIIGDYDADGVNATYVLVTGLARLGAIVDSDIPDRIEDGYGLSMGLIERAYQDDTDIIITCDNGIAARKEVKYAKSLGMTVIVTDHHEVPYETEMSEENAEADKTYILPPADAIINPKQSGCMYPDKAICGCAVAYKLVETVALSLGFESDEFDDLLENVAIATVCDIVDLQGENRILVKEGIERLRRTSNMGLNALMQVCNVDKSKVSVYHLGFVIGPCINAGGRLDTAKRTLELFQSNEKALAENLAGKLKALNDDRKNMTEKAVEEAKRQIVEEYYEEDKVLVLYLPKCHESIAGIVAGRIRELYYKPTIVLTEANEGVKGSGRSIDAYNMFEGLHEVEELFTRYGGHPMAAGLSMASEEDIEVLREKLNRNITLSDEDFVEKLLIDMEVNFEGITREFIEELKKLEPFGKANRRPTFAIRGVKIEYGRVLGQNRNVLKLKLRDSQNTVMDGIYFGDIEGFLANVAETYGKETRGALENGQKMNIEIMLAYFPELNVYMGNESIQIKITDYELR